MEDDRLDTLIDMPRTLILRGDGLDPSSLSLIDADTLAPIIMPIVKIETVMEIGEPNRITVHMASGYHIQGRAEWILPEADLRRLAAAAGFRLVATPPDE